MGRRTVNTCAGPQVRLINITAPGEREMGELKALFPDILDLDLKKCLPPIQRPQIHARENYLFLILLFPLFNRTTREIEVREVDLFLRKDAIVAVHSNDLQPMREVMERCEREADFREDFLGKNTGYALYRILHGLLSALPPMLIHIAQDIDAVEETLHHTHTRDTILEILRIRLNIVDFRKSMQGQPAVIREFIERGREFFSVQEVSDYLNELVEETKEIWELLESDRQTLEALYDSHLSLLNFRQSDIIKTLTMISVITFPLTLLATIFAVNLPGRPFVNSPYGFWFFALIMLGGLFSMIVYFVRKKWME